MYAHRKDKIKLDSKTHFTAFVVYNIMVYTGTKLVLENT